jgi:small subunit ribosomal protein S27Ae
MADEKKAATKAKKKVPAYKRGKACPKCGPGVRLADHKDRRACGKCGYFERK